MNHFTIALGFALLSPALLAGGTHSNGHSHEAMPSSVGEPASGEPDRIIRVAMRDSMRFVFEPRLDALRRGEVVEFRVRNDGVIAHEFSIGSIDEQLRHAAMMREMPDMKHDDPNAITLAPGESGRLAWRFLGNEEVVFACNIPGHFEAGMKHTVAIGRDADDQLAAN